MTHIDRDDLALIALAEFDLTEPERQHLAECPECALELISLQHTVAVGRSARNVELAEPGDQVWGKIHSALGLTGAVAATPRLADYAPAAEPGEPAELAESAPIAEPADLPEPAPATESASVTVTDIGAGTRARARHRRRRVWLPVAVAAGVAGLVGGLGGGIWWESLQQQAPAPVIAKAELDPFPGWNASGVAQVEKTADGHREVVVDLTGATQDAGLREVWLIKADASGLISIGLLDGDTGHFSIPDGVDLSQFPLVDVSVEPDDGNPAHSGDSIVRGELRTI
ncbi:MAG: anti-sigma factor [Ramlibacter sp.]|nr:anti-sigma factor [Cryobacterium sp.]